MPKYLVSLIAAIKMKNNYSVRAQCSCVYFFYDRTVVRVCDIKVEKDELGGAPAVHKSGFDYIIRVDCQ